MLGLGGESLRVKLGPADLFVYLNRLDVRTQTATSQSSFNALPNATIVADYLSTATYRIRCRAEYNENDLTDAGVWNVALPAAQRLAMRQGHFLAIRAANLYGVNSANSEGLINTPNSTSVTSPIDPWGNGTLLTYDNGWLAEWFLGQYQAALQRMYSLGMQQRVVFIGPQRVFGQMSMQNIVQTTSYQRQGAGTATTIQVIQEIAKENGYTTEWAYDDTLIGQGTNGYDAVLLIVPEAMVPEMPKINTNVFAELAPNLKALTMQYADVPAPVEVTTPIVEGLDITSQMRISSGWAPRGEAVTILSIPYSSR